jgi:hypothetical protein
MGGAKFDPLLNQIRTTDTSPAATPTTSGIVKQTVYNVKDYGAVGDDTTDDTTAIQNAITAVSSIGGVVFFPVGNYKITSALTLSSNITIQGSGQNKTQVRQHTPNSDCFSGVDVEYITFKDIQAFGAGSGTGIGIHLTLTSNASIDKLHFQNVVVYNFGGDGINIANAILSTFVNVSCISNKGHGFNFVGGTGGAVGTSVAMSGCYALSNVQAGYRFYSMAYSSLNGCASQGNGIGYLIDTCQSISLLGCGNESPVNNSTSYPGTSFKVTGSTSVGIYNSWVYKTVGAAWLVTGSSSGVQIFGARENSPTGTATASIQVDSGSDAVLSDPEVITATSLAAHTTTILHTASGTSTFASDMSTYGSMTMHPVGNPAITVKSTDDSNYILFYHTGSGGYGQIESSTGFVLFSDSGETTMIGSNTPQARVQHNGGSYHEMNFSHDDTNGTIGTNAGNLILAPTGDVDISTKNLVTDATTGTKIGTATTQKLGFFGHAATTQQVNSIDLGTVLSNLGLRAAGTAYAITTSGTVTFTGTTNLNNGATIPLTKKLTITTGTNASAGTGTLSGGTVTISTSVVTANSLIFLTDTANGANLGILSVGTKSAGASFVVNSSNVLDAGTFNWLVIN